MAALKIVVVDDQPINVQLLKRKLEREGLLVSAPTTAGTASISSAVRNPTWCCSTS
jgi:CheY-like chemotaxis protein